MEEQVVRELQLLLPSSTSAQPPSGTRDTVLATAKPSNTPQLDLNLSMSIGPRQLPLNEESTSTVADAQALKQQAAEQMRLASVEKANAERVRQMARRELELAEKEFARARLIWERAREEVEKVERMKEIATRRIGPIGSATTSLEITCHACMQLFHP